MDKEGTSIRYSTVLPYTGHVEGAYEASIWGYHFKRQNVYIIRLAIQGFDIHCHLQPTKPSDNIIWVSLDVRPNSINCSTTYDYDENLLSIDHHGKVTIQQTMYLELLSVKMSFRKIGDTEEIKAFVLNKLREYAARSGDQEFMDLLVQSFQYHQGGPADEVSQPLKKADEPVEKQS